MRIVSLLPSATEIVCGLGLADALAGITHACDHPPEILGRPVLTRNRLSGSPRASSEVDYAVAQSLAAHVGLYDLDREKLARLDPDLILTQKLCDVCAVSYREVRQAARIHAARAKVVSLEPASIEGIFDTISLIGALTGREARAAEWVARLRERLAALRSATRGLPVLRVYVCEWLDPPYAAGHWVGEQVEAAGGIEAMGFSGRKSERIAPEAIVSADPEAVVLAPCGYTAERAAEEFGWINDREPWRSLPAVLKGNVWAVDANAFFSRPGPRVVDGAELLARVLHPDRFGAPDRAHAIRLETAVAR